MQCVSVAGQFGLATGLGNSVITDGPGTGVVHPLPDSLHALVAISATATSPGPRPSCGVCLSLSKDQKKAYSLSLKNFRFSNWRLAHVPMPTHAVRLTGTATA